MTKPTRAAAEIVEDDRRLSILVVDDHDVIHSGMRLQLARAAWATRCVAARTIEEALDLTRRYEPNVALVDLVLGAESGANACERIREVSPGTHVLLMSGSTRISNSAVRAIGASGFVPKEWPIQEILHAVRAAGLGAKVFAPQAKTPWTTLTGRERDMLDMIAIGASNREIALRHHLSHHTVKEHISSLYRKLDVENRAAAVQRAHRIGLLE